MYLLYNTVPRCLNILSYPRLLFKFQNCGICWPLGHYGTGTIFCTFYTIVYQGALLYFHIPNFYLIFKTEALVGHLVTVFLWKWQDILYLLYNHVLRCLSMLSHPQLLLDFQNWGTCWPLGHCVSMEQATYSAHIIQSSTKVSCWAFISPTFSWFSKLRH